MGVKYEFDEGVYGKHMTKAQYDRLPGYARHALDIMARQAHRLEAANSIRLFSTR